VDFCVLHQGTYPRERFAAYRTGEQFHTGVNLTVCQQAGLHAKTLPAVGTSVLICMNVRMSQHPVHRQISHVADGTRKTLLGIVGHPVKLQGMLVGVAFSARFASVRFLSSMLSHVHFQVVFSCTLFVTNFAYINPRLLLVTLFGN